MVACLAAGSGVVACSLLAPSDEELMGSVGGGGRVNGTGGAGGSPLGGGAGSTSGAGGSADDVEIYPVLPVAGSGGSTAPGPDEPALTPPDAGPPVLPPCVDCERVRILSAGVATVQLGTPGGSLYVEICPQDQVVVGMDYTFDFGTPADFGYFTSVTLVCGELVSREGALDVIIGEPLTPRGAGSGALGTGGRCPPGQVVTAFEGASNFDGTTSEIRELTLHCAPLAFGTDTPVEVGAANPTQPMSADFAVSTVLPDDVLPPQVCPAGQVVRGAAVHAGAWVDGVRFVCGAPVLAWPEGYPCGSANECQSGSCEGTCQPRPCTAAAGCACGLVENTQYAFCEAAQTQSGAATTCATSGMHLARALDPIVHGWLRSTAGEEGIQAAFWLGADDLASEGAWQWVQGGGPVDLVTELWDENELRGGTAENCMAMTRDGHWDDVACALTLPFVCEAPSP